MIQGTTLTGIELLAIVAVGVPIILAIIGYTIEMTHDYIRDKGWL